MQCDGQTTVLQILQAVAAKVRPPARPPARACRARALRALAQLDGSQDAHARFQLLAPGAGASALPAAPQEPRR